MQIKYKKRKTPAYMGLVLTVELRKEIEVIAKRESRSLGNTIRLLLREALGHRDAELIHD